jgi:hypothetical protein
VICAAPIPQSTLELFEMQVNVNVSALAEEALKKTSAQSKSPALKTVFI